MNTIRFRNSVIYINYGTSEDPHVVFIFFSTTSTYLDLILIFSLGQGGCGSWEHWAWDRKASGHHRSLVVTLLYLISDKRVITEHFYWNANISH